MAVAKNEVDTVVHRIRYGCLVPNVVTAEVRPFDTLVFEVRRSQA
jgi:hypothetical protein